MDLSRLIRLSAVSVFLAGIFSLSLHALPACASVDTSLMEKGLAATTVGPVTVIHAPADASLAGETASLASDLHRRISRRLHLRHEVEAAIVLLTERIPDGTYGDLRNNLAPWLAGIAWSEHQFIALRLKPGETSLDGESLLAHELTHVILKGDFPRQGSWPVWFQEGLAMRESGGEGLRSRAALSLAALRGRLIPLHDLRGGFPRTEAGARLAYVQSFSILTYLLSSHGEERFDEFMARLRVDDFDDAFRTTYGYGTGALESRWRRWVKRKYSWIPVATGGTAFWGLTLVIFLLALAVRRRRSRLIEERWEDEGDGLW